VLGSYFITLIIYTNGGSDYAVLTAMASAPPVAVFEYSSEGVNGPWTTIPACTALKTGCTVDVSMGTSNGSGSSGVVLRFTNKGWVYCLLLVRLLSTPSLKNRSNLSCLLD